MIAAFDQWRDFAYNAGYFGKEHREIALVRSADKTVDVKALRHEASHLLYELSAARGMSPWLSEGLAMLHERDGANGMPEASDPIMLNHFLL